MDSHVIQNKLISLKRCIERIESKIPPELTVFINSHDLQDIVLLNLQRAIQISVDIAAHITSEMDFKVPSTMAESFQILFELGVISKGTANRMQKSIGLRNIAVHEYTSLNWDVVYRVATTCLNDFRDYASEIVSWLEKRL
jgi:uncharacterized protein YutE (UPF0331/DUF86 family)